jgi:DNA-binding Lrp family transcriptional regulator
MRKVKRIFIIVLVSFLVFSYIFSSQAEQLAEEEIKEYPLKEKLWAAKWISEKLALLMEDGLIKKIKCYEDDSNYEVFVSSSWHLLSTEEKRDFLSNLSRAREITQHSPYLVVKDSENEGMVAKVDEWGILVFGEEGEKFLPPVPQEDSYSVEEPNVIDNSYRYGERNLYNRD